jgi:GMP synthase (glutamine-hydrolysing)
MREKEISVKDKKFIYILNFGDYFAKLTAKRIRKAGGYPKIISFNTPYKDIKSPAGFILSGSPNGSMRLPVRILCKELFATNFPVMGICIGAQLISRYFGGTYKNLKGRAENGTVKAKIDRRNKLFRGLNRKEDVLMMHEDSIIDPGKDFIVIAETKRCPIAATAHDKWRWYNLQFHPELSDCGDKIFENFVTLCYKDKPEHRPGIKEMEKIKKRSLVR